MLVLALAAGALAGCYDPADPNVYPLRLDLVRTHGDLQYFADLDGDGRDEMIAFTGHAARSGHVALHLQRLDGTSIEQVNMASTYRRLVDEWPRALDLDGDGRLEVLVPLVRADSLVARVYDAEARFVRELFLATGEPRQVPDGELAWDPAIRGFFLEDVNRDGRPELIVVLRTGYARYPRGVIALDLTSGERVDAWLTGAGLRGIELLDADGDGRRELLFESGAPRNGAVAGPLSDDRAHVGVVDLATPMRLRWSTTGDRNRYGGMVARTIDAPRGHVLVIETVGTSRPGPSRLRVVDAASGKVVRELMWPHGVRYARIGRGPDGTYRAWLDDMRGWTTVIDAQFDILVERYFSGNSTDVLDLDGDGIDEVVYRRPDPGWYEFVDADLHVVAVVPGTSADFDVVRHGAGLPTLVGVRDAIAQRTNVYRVVPNPWWWLRRYGPAGLGGGGALLLLGLAVAGVRSVRRHRLNDALLGRVLAGDERGLLVLTPTARSGRRTSAFAVASVVRVKETTASVSGHAFAAQAPDFAAFLAALPTSPPHRREAAVAMGPLDRYGSDAPPAWVVAEPLDVDGRGRPHWLVSVADAPPALGDADGTWPLLARRVVHDLKNPLTSILLTLQRMQMEAHAHAPADVAARLDPYVERVEGRVEHLRRMAQNLLKFLDAAAPDLVETDLCADRRRDRGDAPSRAPP